MTESLLLTIAGALAVAILLLLVVVLLRVNGLIKAGADSGFQELMRLQKMHEISLKEGFSEARKELREVSLENRREMQESFKIFQDTLLNRISENGTIQHKQLESFKSALNDLSERLITNSNEFKQSVSSSFQTSSDVLNRKQDEFREKTVQKLDDFETSIKNDAKLNRQELNDGLKSFKISFSESINDFNQQLSLKFAELNKQQVDATAQSKTSITEIRDTIEKQLRSIREDNTQQLTEMRKTVDEKLQSTLEKRLGESFKQVSDRLEQVHKGLGEMQTLAIGVGDLKKVLANVKTRGILGEYQLGNILEQILTPEQYSTNVATKQGSQANVEFAVKLPGKSDEKTVWLPLDSKFPLESYQLLLLAYDEAEPAKIDQAQKILLKVVESFAKDISDKYIDPPHTTDFAIMFLPVESLFAEVLRHPHMFELLQRKYRITITGPTTLSALLNSLHMGFRTLAVQKRSSEVWKVLAEVKTEFASYSDQLALVHKQLTTASGSLEKLKDTRTKAMERKLRDVAILEITEDKEAVLLLES
ncbi:DNA recombination protein RmuC [Methylobacter sp. S3L5C]|uniref:DNA recombination protein RmuC n=1 Tax=Methylobacter sp. S3L5C TaxID=2839024 RepID=UPI001FAB4CDE|nr:DNA recombination protein RmuC [Methylobacter sp. S3L5C]UOA10346.1 DNA recombination protein RmuC [Methylobacter sp. S3L5C]